MYTWGYSYKTTDGKEYFVEFESGSTACKTYEITPIKKEDIMT